MEQEELNNLIEQEELQQQQAIAYQKQHAEELIQIKKAQQEEKKQLTADVKLRKAMQAKRRIYITHTLEDCAMTLRDMLFELSEVPTNKELIPLLLVAVKGVNVAGKDSLLFDTFCRKLDREGNYRKIVDNFIHDNLD